MRNFDKAKWAIYKPKKDALRAARTAKGLCVHCEHPVVPKKRVCAYHEMQHRSHYLYKMYRITLAQYQELYELHNGSCHICGWQWNSGKRKLAVDHGHNTGLVRGLLCPSCNKGLGVFRDNPSYLARASQYLQENCSQYGWNVASNYTDKREKHRGRYKGSF